MVSQNRFLNPGVLAEGFKIHRTRFLRCGRNANFPGIMAQVRDCVFNDFEAVNQVPIPSYFRTKTPDFIEVSKKIGIKTWPFVQKCKLPDLYS